MRLLRAAALGAGLLAATLAHALPDDAAVRRILAQRIEQKQGVAFAVVLVEGDRTRIVTAGEAVRGGPPVDDRTRFEIGSITKTFTGLLLAQRVLAGDLALDTPVPRLLPPGAAPGLTRDGKAVTLGQLATHTSGLPRLPGNLDPADRTNPYADYDGTRLVDVLAATPLARDPPAAYEYSNFGMGLLGYALTWRDGGYGKVVRERVLSPLGMHETGIDLSRGDVATRQAEGHDRDLAPVPAWTFDALAGAGALRSSAHDMAIYLRAAMRPEAGTLGPAFRLAETPLVAGPNAATRVGLAWHVTTREGRTLTWHNGATYGFASMLAFDGERGEGVVVLGNAAISVDDLAWHLLDPSRPLAAPPTARVAVALDVAALERVTGRYELAPGFVLTVTREGERVFAQATGQGKAQVFPSSELEFYYKVVEAQLVFERDAAGTITGVVLHQGGRKIPGRRLPPGGSG